MIDDCRTVPKMGVKNLIKEALTCGCVISNPIEHYSMSEIMEISRLAKDNDLIFSIKKETSNFYQGIMINLIKRSRVKECSFFINNI